MLSPIPTPPTVKPKNSLPSSRPYVPLCPHSTRQTCTNSSCTAVHFQKIILPHTEESLGDCSYLNTCHRMGGCRYVHWGLELPQETVNGQVVNGVGGNTEESEIKREASPVVQSSLVRKVQNPSIEEEPHPPQWMNVDLRTVDFGNLGKFDIVIADPPWAIHQELPYGTLTDHEMLHMPLGSMQDPGGLLFLWVTGRAMELGRLCLNEWGYERIDEIVWVKSNQLGGLIRTGRTGHWLNHSKEHCLVAVRRDDTKPGAPIILPEWYNKQLDTQVIMAEVRETSRKPDELYEIIERVLAGSGKRRRKVELFGREHNLRSGWLTLGNQFGSGDQLYDPEILRNLGRL